ncbi:DUF4197 domain-containing protein [Pseudodesulfovibrio sp. zrk46]|uniref:DUF4197 domain-containing protein n=1 Tax=Pseudodesulfovibrio sp. zrk46 TaxID=2725288 RepID=UPI0014494BC8|nr:DUF4197 domain-containing protein [Pseudodesulfovibrio sp. zrk46]QJB56525.1 DUF4197 domain-containing protein [Pseudodesulfovibrio sp. zrk46]
MHRQYYLLFYSILTVLLTASLAFAGWGDTLKKAGAELADDGATAAGLPYTPSEAVSGIKEVLELGTDYGVSSLGVPGGFSANSATSLSLPSSLTSLGDTAGLLSSLNTAAEGAIPGTGNVFLDVIKDLAVGDYATLLNGGEDAITRFFESSSRTTLKKLVRPVVDKSVEASGVADYLAPLMAVQQTSGVTGTAFDPVDFVTDKTLDGMFLYMGLKEREIRTSNGAGTTELLQKLF